MKDDTQAKLDVRQFEQRSGEQQKKIDELQQRNEAVQNALRDQATKAAKLKEKCEQQSGEWQKKIDELQQRNEAVQNALRDQATKAAKLKEKCEQQSGEWQKKIDELQQRNVALESGLALLLQDKTTELQNMKQARSDAEEKQRILQNKLADAEKEVSECRKLEEQNRSQARECTQAVKDSAAVFAGIKEYEDRLKSSLCKDVESQVQTLKEEVEALHARKRELKQAIDSVVNWTSTQYQGGTVEGQGEPPPAKRPKYDHPQNSLALVVGSSAAENDRADAERVRNLHSSNPGMTIHAIAAVVNRNKKWVSKQIIW